MRFFPRDEFMKSASIPYRRLGYGAHRYESLWLGPDHLLRVTSDQVLGGWTEKYQRFYFRDVEAVFTAPSVRWKVGTALLGLAIAGLLLMIALTLSPPSDLIFWIFPLGFLVIWLIVRLARGPKDLVYVQTSAALTPAMRYHRRRFPQLLAELTPLIEAAQQDLPPLPPAG